MEYDLLSVGLKSRDDFYQVHAHIDLKIWTREFQIVWAFVKDYYDRDHQAQYVDRDVFAELMRLKVSNDKHTEKFVAFVDKALALDTSTANVKEVIFLAKKDELRVALALALSNGKEHEDLLEQYQEILRYTDLDQILERGVEMYTEADLDRLLEAELDDSKRIPIMPLSLNSRLDEGLRGGDHLTLFARPEMGKTAEILTMACGAAKAGFKVIAFNNEERIDRLYIRGLSCMTMLPIPEIRMYPDKAKELAMKLGFGNIRFISLSPGSLRQIEEFVDKYDPDVFIVDQLRNLEVKSESRTNQLEAAATGIRNIGKKYNKVAISTTQAGDSAEGKAILTMGDVDYSNTGIPAQCDVLLGIGATPDMVAQNLRCFALSKNKISGDHSDFPVRINPLISKYASADKTKGA